MGERLRTRTVLMFWLPLAVTWLMMSLEGPYLSAIVARLGAPVVNLAAFGLAFSFAWLAESPIIMLLTASTALAKDRSSFLALRRFVLLLNTGVTSLLLLIVAPPVFGFLTERVMGLPPEVASLANTATALLLPWPASIGYRRFYQGILVRNRVTRRVAYGTVVRLVSMSAGAAALALATPLPGACIAALALSAGVVGEAVASRWMARHLVARLLAEPPSQAPAPSMRELAHFYFPLALTSMISMTTGPLLTFFMGRGASPVKSLAAWPVVQAFAFFFRSGGVSFQEVGVALSGETGQNAAEVRRTALLLASGATLVFAAISFSPLLSVWYGRVVGLEAGLLPFAVLPTRLLLVLPALEYALSFQRSAWVIARKTRVVTAATAIEAGGLVVWMSALLFGGHLPGTVAAAGALTLGRLGACGFLLAKARGKGRLQGDALPATA